WFLAEVGCEVRHPGEDLLAAGRTQALGVTLRAMAAAAEANHRHASSNRSFDARNTVLHHYAVFRRRTETLRGEQEQIRRWLPDRDLRGAEHVGLEERQQAGD